MLGCLRFGCLVFGQETGELGSLRFGSLFSVENDWFDNLLKKAKP